MSDLRFDQICRWSEIKIEILRKYAAAYAKVLAKQPQLKFSYIDAFAGPGKHLRKHTGEQVEG